MTGVSSVEMGRGLPASAVLRLRSDRPVEVPRSSAGDEMILAGVSYPPRVGEVRKLAALMPEVLARYGLECGVEGVDLMA
jgi:hypothetical protein